MADTVRYLMEEMVPELEDMVKQQYFSKEEVKQIVKRRQDFEYLLKRKAALKEDFLRYAESLMVSLRSCVVAAWLQLGSKHPCCWLLAAAASSSCPFGPLLRLAHGFMAHLLWLWFFLLPQVHRV